MGGLGRRRPQKITSGKTTKIMQKVGNYFISIQKRAKHTLPDLPFEYHELEPVVSAEIMKLHHQKHHQAYVNNLNVAEEKLHEAQLKSDISAEIALQSALKFNGGGIRFLVFFL